jgi:serine/threonine protein phosphatase PrpC
MLIIQVTVEDVTDSMEFVLLATDGLWDVLEPQEAVNFVRRSLYDNGCLDRSVGTSLIALITSTTCGFQYTLSL